jgi:predicted enzyme involved in methoxymalonyl-ACP biosynthesis
VETAFLAGIACEAAADGAREIFAAFIPTAKNAPASSFLPDHGFEIAEGDAWRIAISAVPEAPPFVELRIS